jgi:cell division protein FtsZ
MSEGGAALMAVGRSTGDERARKAAEAAIASGLLDVTIDGARGILFNITGGSDLSLFEVNEAAAIIKESAHPEVNMIFGAQIDESMGDEVRITVIATGFEQSRVARKMDQPQAATLPIRQQQPVQQARAPQQPQQPMRQAPIPPAQTQRPAAPTQPPAAQPPAENPGQQTRVYDDDLSVPAFIRNKPRR